MSTNYDSLIRDLELEQDTVISGRLNSLKSNPAQASSYINTNKTDIYNKIVSGHNNIFNKEYSDLRDTTAKNTNQLYINTLDTKLNSVLTYNNIVGESHKKLYDNDLAKRQYEINEWASSNKLDTLFVFQILFICILVETLLVLFWRKSFIGSGLLTGLSLIIAVIFTFTVVNRAQYTLQQRNGRYWNQRNFEVYGKKPIPVPTCQNTLDAAANITKKVGEILS